MDRRRAVALLTGSAFGGVVGAVGIAGTAAGIRRAAADPGDPDRSDPAAGDPAAGDPESSDPAVGRRIHPTLTIGVPAHAVSERGFTVAARLTARPVPRSAIVDLQKAITVIGGPGTPRKPAAGMPAHVRWRTVHRIHLDAHGHGAAIADTWKSGHYRLLFTGDPTYAPTTSRVVTVTAAPSQPPVVAPAGAPSPRAHAPWDLRATGVGANATITVIPDAVWARMQGISWRPGAPVGRSDLRYVRVNFWGFDGYRYRGEMVLNAPTARAAAGALTALFHLRFPIRAMVLPDVFGRSRFLGADDYRSMAADNTSGFNYRYVDGEERQRVLSPHAYGNALDINTWENPYEAPTGVFPDSYYLHRSTGARGLFLPHTPQTAALTARGFVWGASYGDFQHFQLPYRSAAGLLPMSE